MSWIDRQRMKDGQSTQEQDEVDKPATGWLDDRLYDHILDYEEIKAEDEEGRPREWGKLANVFMKEYQDAFGRVVQIPVKKFTDTSRILKTGNHVFIIGVTGCGKTVLQYGLILMLYNTGFGVINRDDGGLESLLLAPLIPNFHIWVPKGVKFQTGNWRPPNPPHYFDPLDQEGLVRELLKPYGNTPAFHTILFDAYSLLGEAPVKFWGPFHKHFIFALQQIPTHRRKRLILSVDELHDIVQPGAHSLTREHAKTRTIIEQIYRKLRKYGCKVIASAHRPNQLPINVRSQFAYFIFKRTYPSDAYSLLSQKLTHVQNKLFWLVVSDVTSRLHESEFYLFDDRGHFDKCSNVDLERYSHLLTRKERIEQIKQFGYVQCGLKTEIAGSVDELFSPSTEEGEKIFDWRDLIIFYRRAFKRGHMNWKSYIDLAEELGMGGKSTVQDHCKKMYRIDRLDEFLRHIVQ